ncbi:cobalamin-dependent protein [Patescibacteria group bacterium]|nr:cobalamin-dependent protein [Patescibacteria group bacterium]
MILHKVPHHIIFVIAPVKIFSCAYPLGLGYITAVLKQNQYDVEILDFSKKKYSLDRAVKEIILKEPDFIGFTVYSYNYNAIKSMIRLIKEAIPVIKVIVGGPHVSALPKFSLEGLRADFAVVGEGEQAILEIIKRSLSHFNYFEDIKGLAFWKDDVAVLNPGCNLIENLDNLPFPDWEAIPPTAYGDVAGQTSPRQFPCASILTSRGCPHQCTFCASHLIHGRGLRKRSAKNVVNEIECLVKKYGVREINFSDDTFSEDRNHAIGICEELIKRKVNIVWRTTVGLRLDTLDEGLLEAFIASGCYQLAFGIESFASNVLHEVKKPINRLKILEKIHMVKKFKIETFGYFILGLPQDTVDSIRQTISFARNSDLDYLSFSHAIPLPGTEIFNKRYKNSRLSSIDWNNFYFFGNRPFDISEIPSKKLKKLYSAAYITSYIRPKRIKLILSNFINFKKTKTSKVLKFIYYITRNLF